MSYSRWSTSTWYTYYNTSSGNTLDDQVFSVCEVKDFTYKELKTDIEKCLDDCEAEGAERTELKSYMEFFMLDAEAEFKPRQEIE